MKVFLLVMGTRGDFELFLGLGQELAGRGHEVRIASSCFFAESVRDSGLDWLPVGLGTREQLVGLLRSLADLPGQRERVETYFRRWVWPQLGASIAPVRAALADADYFVSNLKSVWTRGGRVIPGANVTYEPAGSLENLTKHMPRRIEHRGALLQIVALSRALVDPEDRWGDEYKFTGFWEVPARRGYKPPRGLAEFLENGEPPVVLTMGSMVMFDARRLLSVFVEALRRADRRGLVVGGWSGVSNAVPLPDSVYSVDEAPYDWLFPQVSCVIHHGGCGTVAATLRAARPSILLPLIPSQEHFAKILCREELAVASLNAASLDAAQLASGIDAAITGERFLAKASVWQAKVSLDGGLRAAGDRIEGHGVDVLRGIV